MLGICQIMFKSKTVIVIYLASNKLKQLNSIIHIIFHNSMHSC